MTIGYSTRSIDQFDWLLRVNGTHYVVELRSFPVCATAWLRNPSSCDYTHHTGTQKFRSGLKRLLGL
jgi:hypothetical protein